MIITVTYDLNPLMTDHVIITITEPVLLSPPYQEVSYYLEQMPIDSGYDVDWMLRSGAGYDTNLYALALIADKVAFNTYIPSTLIRTTWETSPGESIIIPVSPGMRISANSFGLAGLNGGTSNGIRISYMSTPDASGETMISQLTPLEAFLEFSTSTPDAISGLPYLTVPMTCGTHQWPSRYMEVVFWTGDGRQNRWVFNLDLNGWRMV
ncbi:MAG: hypothetical protein K9K93_06590 [Acholeplasmataceae bacterium]|nr:hypothetical protein [Acholeplasmataceae bacterium]